MVLLKNQHRVRVRLTAISSPVWASPGSVAQKSSAARRFGSSRRSRDSHSTSRGLHRSAAACAAMLR
ncbi:hypothetical protein SAMN05216275_10843 [Streptosporangium canum]|uniref:Uncharacterized protein n=2 Tax=Streptosporangium canum TaxID=324952 RepID=A0A1I3QI51_9ACTN|nr:hypothetical protein SAMN05216275_10843 [Streptosporangium canum]